MPVTHVCFGGHMDVNCSASLQTLNVSDDMKWTTNTHVTPFTIKLTFKGTDYIYDLGRLLVFFYP